MATIPVSPRPPALACPRHIARVWSQAVDGFRMYRATALLLGATGMAALAATLPVALLIAPASGGLGMRLGLATIRGGGLGLPWIAPPQFPADTQTGALRFFFNLLLVSTAATLAISAISLLTLFGARALARESEVAVRRAVGASRSSLVSAALLEGLLIAAAVLLGGGMLGVIGAGIAQRGWPGVVHSGGAAPGIIAASAVTIFLLLGALLPVLFARRQRITEAEAKPSALFGPAVLQLGFSLIMLATGALLVRHVGGGTAALAGHTDPVFALEAAPGDAAARSQGYEALLAALGRHPELGTISLTSPGAVVGLGPLAHVTTDCGLCYDGGLPIRWHTPTAMHQFVSADSFLALGIHLLAGRGISPQDRLGAGKVAVVSRSLAQDHFQNGEAIGRTMKVADDADDWYTVVGIVDDPVPTGLGGGRMPTYAVYLSILQHPASSVDLLLRSPSGALAVTAMNVLVADAVDPHARRLSVTPESALLRAELAPLAWFGGWLRLQGLAMLLIAATGLFALMNLWVRSAWPEFGMRRAVGARRWQIGAMILRRAAQVGLGGVLLGYWFGPALWSGLPEVVSGLAPWDPAALLPYGALLTAVATAGAAVPAWAALHATPHALLGSTGE